MKVRSDVLVFYVVVFILLGMVSVGNCRSRRVKRIVNGELVDMDTQPRVASLRLLAAPRQHLCGATLLSRQHAVTAAHCVRADKQYVLMLNNCRARPAVPVLGILVHHQYDKHSRAHDIALLRINATNIQQSEWLDEDILPKNCFGLSGECVTYGYGARVPYSQQTSEQLLSARVRVVSLDECEAGLGRYMAPAPDAGMLCAVGVGGADSCQGDSGGPVLCGGALEGVSSHGQSCGVPDRPAVYTSVGCHKKWIQAVILHDTLSTEPEDCL